MKTITSHLPLLRAALLLCLMLGLANVAGWVFDIPLLLSVFDRFPRMVPLTAGLTLLCTVGVWLQAPPRPMSHVARGAGVAVAALGLATLGCYLLGAAPPPFRLSESFAQGPASLPAPLSAALFCLLGMALAALAHGRGIRVAQVAAMVVVLLSLLNLAGFLFRDTFLYEILPGSGVSLLTTVAVILLALVMLMLRPTEGIMVVLAGSSPSARIARRLLLSAVAVPVVLGAAAITALRTGVQDTGTLLPLLAWGTIVLLALLIWHFAFRLYHIDLARTRAEQELKQAIGELRAERDRKDVFLATLAHELRNPLAPIRSAADLLRHLRDPERARLDAMSDLIGRQVDQMIHLVDDLLDVSRVGRGQLKLDLHPVDLRAVVTDAWEQVRPTVERKRQVCDLALAAEPIGVLGDHKRLVQVVANLLGNAAKYTPEGGQLQLRLDADAGTGMASIAVRDNGIGIDAALLPTVFDTFTQGSLTPERGEGGLGLGLALVKRLTEMHGGTVHAESGGEGRGSLFVVRLPRVPEGDPGGGS